ncbi:hypothetical protein EON65_23500 [archaeon]|nr:MAG: hypothetical protein EON65_23500 [archaeon]
MRDPSLRKEYETFNDRNQSLPSLLWLNLFLLAATTLISLIILLTLAYGKVIVGWVSLLIGTVVLNAFVFYAYVHLKKTVKQNNYTLPDRSRKFLKWLHIAIFILIQFFICRRMLAKSLAGECDEDEEKDLLGDWRCNPQHNSASLPSGISLCVMLWPIFHVVCVRGAYIGWTLLMWVSGVGCMITAIVLGGLTGSTSSTVVYIVTSLFIIAELKRQNYVMYFLDRRLQTMLREKERQTDEENATEMRHMIANVAHDLKTVSNSVLFVLL